VSKYDEVKKTKNQKFPTDDEKLPNNKKNNKSSKRDTKKTKKKNQYSNIKSANQ
jgi:hypothetical protein